MKKTLKKVLTLTLALCSVMTMTLTAFADEPYETYNYDSWDETIPSQSGYIAKKTVTGKEIGLDKLATPGDPLFVSENAAVELSGAKDFFLDDEAKEFWVADTANNRILRLDINLNVIGRYYGVTGKSEVNVDKTGLSRFNTPSGIYVAKSAITGDLMMYVADMENDRIVKAKVTSPTECVLVQEYFKPEEAVYEAKTFKPSKVIADNAENVYAVVNSVNTGAVQFSKNGNFTGFYGANRVEVTASVIADKLWRKIASNDQIAGMSRNVPSEFANFDIDDDGFIYTVTEIASEGGTDAVKKLNPAGYNIWDNEAGDEYEFGDVQSTQNLDTKQTLQTKLTDIVVSNNGLISVLDFETGRIFQYDKLCNLVCIFGGKNSAHQKGSFSAPNAIEALDNNVYVIDGVKNDITVFEETTFGSVLHEAYLLYGEGKYVQAEPYWNEVIARDGGYTSAYVGLGKAALNNNDYSAAKKHFKVAYDQKDYNKAFEYSREIFLRDNFTVIIIIVLAVIILWIVIKKLLNKRKLNKAKEGK